MKNQTTRPQLLKTTVAPLVAALVLSFLPQVSHAVELSATRGSWEALNEKGHPYRLLLPFNYDPAHERYPVVLFLHGQGDDVSDPAVAPAVVDTYMNTPEFRKNHPAILVAPQCIGSTKPADCSWGGSQSYERNGEQAALEITKHVIANYAVDASRVYVTGISLGGNGVWDMIWRYNDVFAAALPVSGATWYWKSTHAKDLLNTPIWAAHGELDPEVPVTYDRDFFASTQALGGTKMRYTEYSGQQHDVWTTVYSDDAYFIWLFSQHKSAPFS